MTNAPQHIDDRAVVVLDCETTGTNSARDQVIEVCAQLGLVNGECREWRIKPSVPIAPEAQAVHGITAEQLAACPPFADVADAIAAVLYGAAAIVGYNVAFDIDMLLAEFARCGRAVPDLSKKHIVDAYRLWQQCEPRKLADAHRHFVGDSFVSAHSARADVAATARVVAGMIGAFGLDAGDWAAIAHRADPDAAKWVGPSRHLRWENGAVVLAFGKHRGVALADLAAGPDRGFLQWLLSKDFPLHVKEIARAALFKPRGELATWIAAQYPPPVATSQEGAA